jgi:hypothetical protein
VLPFVPLSLPSQMTFPLLHAYLYTHSTAALLSSLLLPPPLQANLILPADVPNLTSMAFRLERVRSLRENVVALEITDEKLWKTMSRAWETLMREAEPEVEGLQMMMRGG